jgi:hypothetical protein
MYLAFYILNTFFAVLSAVFMVLITETKNFVAANSEKMLMVSTGIFVIGLTQFVIVSYECSSYFFLLLFFFILIRYVNRQSVAKLLFLVFIIMISTLNRESSALSLSLAAVLFFDKFGLKKKTFIPVLILGISFAAVYFGIRFSKGNFITNDGNLLYKNFTQPKGFLGILFWLLFFFLSLMISKNKTAAKNILIFHFFAFPYILMCVYSGILYEVRLYVPIFLTSLFLAKFELKADVN